MAVNRFFNQKTFVAEQTLVQDLIDESIQIYGHDVYYIPRASVNLDTFLGEDPLKEFTDVYPIEMYVKSFESFMGQSEFISKFGLQIEDQIILVVSQRRFDLGVRHDAEEDGYRFSRPMEGDLIYMALNADNRYLFEIRFVENKETLFQLGKLYTYELRCEIMNFGNERVKTDVPDVDSVAQDVAYTMNITMETGGTGAYEVAESVFQGATLATATATGVVYAWDTDNTYPVLSVQRVTGVFSNSAPVHGHRTFASWTPRGETPDVLPIVHDPISDNTTLDADDAEVILNRGSRHFEE